jgi:hypothetical protein
MGFIRETESPRALARGSLRLPNRPHDRGTVQLRLVNI